MPMICTTRLKCVSASNLLSCYVDAPVARSNSACITTANILLKAHVLNISDKEKAVG